MSDLFTRDDLIRKISALLTTAESFAAQGNEEAAEAYIAKAHALQQKYSIDQAMLADSATKPERIISKRIDMVGAHGRRKVDLAHIVAVNTNCTGYFGTTVQRDEKGHPVSGPKVYYYMVFGFESDVAHVETMIASLNHQADSSLAVAVKTKPDWEHGKSFAASFFSGFTNAIASRLVQVRRTAETEATRTYGTSVSLVLVSRRDQVRAEMKARVGRLRTSYSGSGTSRSGFVSGRRAGEGATIARGSLAGRTAGALGH